MSGVLALILRLLVSSFLYAFLGWALWSLWRDLQTGSRATQAEAHPSLELFLHQEEEERRCRSNGALLTIGRDPANDCVIPDTTVSAYHAQLEFHHNQWWLRDLGSRNGTFLNQQLIQDSVVVTSGDQLRFGSVTMDLSIQREN